MDDIKQERPSESPILNLIKRLLISKQEIWYMRQGIYDL